MKKIEKFAITCVELSPKINLHKSSVAIFVDKSNKRPMTYHTQHDIFLGIPPLVLTARGVCFGELSARRDIVLLDQH